VLSNQSVGWHYTGNYLATVTAVDAKVGIGNEVAGVAAAKQSH